MGFGGNQVFDAKFGSNAGDFSGVVFPQQHARTQSQFRALVDEPVGGFNGAAMKLHGSASNQQATTNNTFGFQVNSAGRRTGQHAGPAPLHQQHQQQYVQQHAQRSSHQLHLVSQQLQAVPPSIAVFGDYADHRASVRAFPVAHQQHQAQSNLYHPQQLNQQPLSQFVTSVFSSEPLRSAHVHKSIRNLSPSMGDGYGMDGMSLEPKRRTRRRRRRQRKHDTTGLAEALLGGSSVATNCLIRHSPNSFDDDEDDDDLDVEDSNMPEQAGFLSVPPSLSGMASSSTSARSSFLDMDGNLPMSAADATAVNCKDPWRSREDECDVEFELMLDDELAADSCFLEASPASPTSTSTSSGHLSSCISQLFLGEGANDADDSQTGRLESTLRSALAWHEQFASAIYLCSRP